MADTLKQIDLASDTAWTLSIDDGEWRSIRVPAGGYNSDDQPSPLIHFREVKDHVAYRRMIDLPAISGDQMLQLEVGAVNHGCEIYIDGQLVHTRVGPLMPFEVDISNHATPGVHELIVKSFPQWHYENRVPQGFIYEEARDSFPTNSERTRGGFEKGWATRFGYGIVKYIRLAVYPAVRIKSTFVRTSVSQKTLSCDVWIDNNTKEPRKLTLFADISAWNKPAQNQTGWTYPNVPSIAIQLSAGETRKVTLGPIAWTLGPDSYWWPNKPFREDYLATLHNLNLTLKEDQTIRDRRTQRFGFVEWTEGQFYYRVNGVRINQISDGTPEPAMSHYDCYSQAPAFLPPGEKTKGFPETLKRYMRLGISANRIHQSTPTQYMLDTADELGFMFVAETPIRGCQAQNWSDPKPFIQSVQEMALVHRNHPSVCRYSLMNEDNPKHAPMLIDAILPIDDTRPLVIEDNQLNGPKRIEGDKSKGHAFAISHYDVFPNPATMISGMGEFAWIWYENGKMLHRLHTLPGKAPAVLPWAHGGLNEFVYYGNEMRRADLAYIAGWDFINYWPNFLEGMTYEKHPWKQSAYPKDRVDGVDGWNSPTIRWVQRYFHPYLLLDHRLHEQNPGPDHWPASTDTYRPGDLIERKIELFNDGLFGSSFSIQWQTHWDSPTGPLVDSGSITDLSVAPGFHQTVPLSFRAPASDHSARKLFLILKSILNGQEVFIENEIYFNVQK